MNLFEKFLKIRDGLIHVVHGDPLRLNCLYLRMDAPDKLFVASCT